MYKQEKDQRASPNRRPPPHFSLSKQDIPLAPQPHTQKPALHLVDSIVEDDEETPSPQTRARQGSVASQPTASFAAIIPNRVRSISTSSPGIRSTNSKSIRSPSTKAAPSSFSRNIPQTQMAQTRDLRKPSDNGLPIRTRNRQRRRDSLDLDDVMNGSDDDVNQGSVLRHQNSSPPTPQLTSRAQYPVSAHTRDLMIFLAEGPPEPKASQSGSELLDFLAQGPPEYGGSALTLEDPKPKGAGRLQRMISKLSIGGEKAKAGFDTSKTPSLKQPTTPVHSTISSKPSIGTLSSLANRPIPPRPRPISPPPSPQFSYDEDKSIRSPVRSSHRDTSPPRETPLIEKAVVSKPITLSPAPVPSNKNTQEKPIHRLTTNHVNGNGNGNARNGYSPKDVNAEPQHPVSPTRISRKAVPAIDPPSTPFFTETDAKDMQRLFTNATTVDECRLIFDMFMARNGITKGSAPETDAPYPSPSPSVIKHVPLTMPSSDGDALTESILVELFLGGIATPDVVSQVPSEQKQPDTPVEALPATTEPQVVVKPVTNTAPSNRPLVRPLPIIQGSPISA